MIQPGNRSRTAASRQHLFDHMAFHIREATLEAIVLKGQAFVVEAEEVEDRCVEVIERMNVFHGFLAEFVAFAGANAGFDAGTRHPAGEAIGVVITTFGSFLEEGHAAKLGAPDD
jgi:hypothetical protein